MPCCVSVRSRRSPQPSAPTLPRNATRAPSETAANALLAPPPPTVSTMDETAVSPSAHKCSPARIGDVFTSRLMLPTTQRELPPNMGCLPMWRRLKNEAAGFQQPSRGFDSLHTLLSARIVALHFQRKRPPDARRL